jgi:hypothetical protein
VEESCTKISDHSCEKFFFCEEKISRDIVPHSFLAISSFFFNYTFVLMDDSGCTGMIVGKSDLLKSNLCNLSGVVFRCMLGKFASTIVLICLHCSLVK